MDIQNQNTFKEISVIIGQGKISSHIPQLFSSLSDHFIFLKSKTENFLEFQHEVQTLLLNKKIKSVFIAVQDRNIESVYFDIKSMFDSDTVFFHMSGSLFFENIIGLHPLMTFSDDSSNINYNDIKIFTDNEKFYFKNKTAMPSLKYISPDLKPLYHAMAVMMGNFPQYYLQMMKEQFPKELDFLDYQQLTLSSVKNIFKDNSRELLTGPFIRNDKETISKHKSVLESKSFELFKIYQQMEHLFHKEFFK